MEVWLDSGISNDPSFLRFLHNLNTNYKWRNLSGNILQMDALEIEKKDVLNDASLMSIFLNEDFFYFDYFYVAINNEKYTLCYLLFLYKILKNMENYKIYYEIEYKKYHNNRSILKKAYKTFVYCKFDKFLNNNSNSQFNIDFSSSIKNKNFNNLNFRYNIKQKGSNYNYNYNNFLKYFEEFEKNAMSSEFKTFSDFIYSDLDTTEMQERIQYRKALLLE
jgi:hypothetical protein